MFGAVGGLSPPLCKGGGMCAVDCAMPGSMVVLMCPFLASVWGPGGKGVTSSVGFASCPFTPYSEGLRVMASLPLPGSDLPRGPAAAHGEEHQNGRAIY